MPHTPQIAIVTPSFNQAAFLEATIVSILSQKYSALQYVVMDGGSTDGSDAVVDRHRNQLHHCEVGRDGGQYDAINKGFAKTDAEIMGWLNSDDMHTPWTLSVVGEIFATFSDVQWLTTRFPIRWDRAGRAVTCRDAGGYSKESILAGETIPGNGLPGTWPIQQESTFWRRSLWEKAGSHLDASLDAAADYELWLRFARHADIYSVGVPLAGFRRHGDQKTSRALEHYTKQAKLAFLRSGGRCDSASRRRLRSLCRGPLPHFLRPWAARAGLMYCAKGCERSRDNSQWQMVETFA